METSEDSLMHMPDSNRSDVLLTIYYFGEDIGSCEDYSTITSIISEREGRLTIHEIKKSVSFFLRQNKVDMEAIKAGPVTIESTTVSPLYAVTREKNTLTALEVDDRSGIMNSTLPRNMIAVIASERHVSEILSNIERMNVVVGKEPGALNTLENWCMQDSKSLMDDFFLVQSSADATETSCGKVWKGKRVDIILAGGNKMPVPKPQVTITNTTKTSDIHDRQYTLYHMTVKQAGLEWTIAHRYSDFVALHSSLLEQHPTDVGFIPKAILADPPRKELGPSNSVDDSVVKKRTVALQAFVKSLLSNPNALSNIHILSFFGILSTSRYTHSEKLGSRNTIHLSKLKTDCRWGDLILFKCRNGMSKLQRSVTGAEWDHVGIVVRGNNMSTNTLELLEATGEGVTSYPLFSRLRAYYDTNFAEYMCLRRLDVGRDIELFQKLHRFAARVKGKPYGFTFSKLISARSMRSSTISRAPDEDCNMMPRAQSESDLSHVIHAQEKGPLCQPHLCTSKSEPTSHERQETVPDRVETAAELRMSNITSRSSYCDLPPAPKDHRQLTPPKKSVSGKEKIKQFLKEHRIYKPHRKHSSDDSCVDPGGEDLVRVETCEGEQSSFFCSELVAACLQTMDLLPKDINVSAIWPGSFTSAGDIDKMLLAGAVFGDELVLDCRVMEISRARTRTSWSGKHSIIDPDYI